jgi:hypothetical protein
MSIGPYTKAMLFLITKLSLTTPIILNIPWLQKYKPCPSFRELKIYFNLDYYSRNCLLWGIADGNRNTPYRYSVLLSLVPKTTYKALTVKDIPDKREPI